MVKDAKTGEIFRTDHLVEAVLEARLKGDREARGQAAVPEAADDDKKKKKKRRGDSDSEEEASAAAEPASSPKKEKKSKKLKKWVCGKF